MLEKPQLIDVCFIDCLSSSNFFAIFILDCKRILLKDVLSSSSFFLNKLSLMWNNVAMLCSIHFFDGLEEITFLTLSEKDGMEDMINSSIDVCSLIIDNNIAISILFIFGEGCGIAFMPFIMNRINSWYGVFFIMK